MNKGYKHLCTHCTYCSFPLPGTKGTIRSTGGEWGWVYILFLPGKQNYLMTENGPYKPVGGLEMILRERLNRVMGKRKAT